MASMSELLEPARTVVMKIGGDAELQEAIRKTAAAAGVHRTRVYRWMQPKALGGTDGRIPGKHQSTLLEWARAHGVKLKPDDFFLGGGRVRPTRRAAEARSERRVA